MSTCDRMREEVLRHLGGEANLRALGARIEPVDDAQIALKFNHANPRGVRSIIITERRNGFFDMDCFGPMRLNVFRAEQLGRAEQVVPDSLASVLGMMIGVESLHHHHF